MIDCCLAPAAQSDTVARYRLRAVTDGDCVIPLSGRVRTDGHAVIIFDNGTFTDDDTAFCSYNALRLRAGTDDNRVGRLTADHGTCPDGNRPFRRLHFRAAADRNGFS